MYSINAIFKHTEPTTGNTFKGEYVGGPVTLNMKTGEQGTQICLKSKDGKYKWVERSQCTPINTRTYSINKSENS